MFNTTNISLRGSSQTVQFNAPCTGILQRSHPKSVFVRFQKGSDMESWVFPIKGETAFIFQYETYQKAYYEYSSTDGRVEVIVLQVLIFGDNSYLVEVVETKYINEEVKQ